MLLCTFWKLNLITELFFYADLPFGHSCILHCVLCYIWISPWCTRSFGGGLLLNFTFLLFYATYGVASIRALLWSFPVLLHQFYNLFCLVFLYMLFQIRSVEAVHRFFEKFPEAFMDKLHVAVPKRFSIFFQLLCHLLLWNFLKLVLILDTGNNFYHLVRYGSSDY